MKKYLLAAGLCTTMIFSTAFAKDSKAGIALYAEPNEQSKVIAQIDTTTLLVPIYQQGDWLKVGNPQNGDVGWINNKDNKNNQTLAYTVSGPSSQSVIISVSNDGSKDNGTKIIAYQNGKMLDEKEAKAAFEKAKKDQEEWNKQWRAWENQMNETFEKSMQWLHDFRFPTWNPVVVVVPNTTNATNK